MSRRLRCPDCDQPMSVLAGSRAHPTPLGVLRHKRCRACGATATTVELLVRDIPRVALAYLTQDQRN